LLIRGLTPTRYVNVNVNLYSASSQKARPMRSNVYRYNRKRKPKCGKVFFNALKGRTPAQIDLYFSRSIKV